MWSWSHQLPPFTFPRVCIYYSKGRLSRLHCSWAFLGVLKLLHLWEDHVSLSNSLWCYKACWLPPLTPQPGNTDFQSQHTTCMTENHLSWPQGEASGTACSLWHGGKCIHHLKLCMGQSLCPDRDSCSNTFWATWPAVCHHHNWECLGWSELRWGSLLCTILHELLHKQFHLLVALWELCSLPDFYIVFSLAPSERVLDTP